MLRERFKKTVQSAGKQASDGSTPQVPDGMFRKCKTCKSTVYEEDLRAHSYCCPDCGAHFRIDPWTRINLVTDQDSFEEWDADLVGDDPLQFPDYEEKLETLRQTTGLTEAVVTGKAAIRGIETAIGVMSPDFMMGSMGTAVGEKITRMIERATENRLSVILFCCSGGARMQEGIFSLMQMAKTSQALKRHDAAGLLYVSVLTDPTMGGVTASFAMLGDVILAEPGAMIGFAGERVIRQTIGQKLPEGFQSAEFLQKHGFVDRIVRRDQMRGALGVLLKSCG
jgi:acetyl-CoA carboxylase carboxyl transferase subunit beta